MRLGLPALAASHAAQTVPPILPEGQIFFSGGAGSVLTDGLTLWPTGCSVAVSLAAPRSLSASMTSCCSKPRTAKGNTAHAGLECGLELAGNRRYELPMLPLTNTTSTAAYLMVVLAWLD